VPRGQASLEYLGVLALVAVVLAAAGALTGAPDLAGAVGAQVRRALCIVAGGDCRGRAGPVPCVTAALEERDATDVSVLLLRLADGRVVLREQRSDGSVAVTVVHTGGAGIGFVFGAEVVVGGRSAEVGGEAEARLRATAARRFVLPDGPSADRLVAKLRERDPGFGGVARELARLARGGADAGPAPDEREVALGGELDGDVALEAVGLGAHAEALGAATVGLRVHERTGERSAVLRLDGEVLGSLVAPRAALAFGLPSAVTATVTFDRAGRPVRLVLAGAQAVRGSGDGFGHAGEGGDRVEGEVRLELRDPAARADLLGALAGRPEPAARTARRLVDDARVDVRVYATQREETTGGASIGAGGSLGYETAESLERRDLVRAVAREPGQGWGPNLECELAA
jgi:hypothetical protein